MRVAVLGVGGLGRALIHLLRGERAIDALLLLDKATDRIRFFATTTGRVRIEARPFNLDTSLELSRVLRGCDVAVNTIPPKHNLQVMRACADAGVHYLDVAASGPREPGALPGILEQLQLHETFRGRGLRALVSMGLDPGMSNVLAREAADSMDSIDAIRIRSGGTAKLPGVGLETFPMYSRETFLSDILLPPTIWSGGRLEGREPMSEPEDYPFPAPVGVQRAFLVSHEEVKTLPTYLGKPVGRVDFKHAFDPHLVEAVLSMDRLGLLAEDRTIPLGSQRMPFWRVFLQTLPEPSALVRPISGAKALSVEVEGTADGKRTVRRRDIVMEHAEAARRASTAAVVYLTAAAAVVGTLLIGGASFPAPGVYPAEALDPAMVLKEWAARGLPLSRSERPAPN